MEEELLKETPIQDGLMRIGLVLLGLSILLTIVFVCLPDRANLSRQLRAGLNSLKLEVTQAVQSGVASVQSQAAAQKQSAVASVKKEVALTVVRYADPRIQRTLDLPWAN